MKQQRQKSIATSNKLSAIQNLLEIAHDDFSRLLKFDFWGITTLVRRAEYYFHAVGDFCRHVTMVLCVFPATFLYYPFPKQWLRALGKKRRFFTDVLDNVNEFAIPQSRWKKWCVFYPLLFALAIRHFRGLGLTLHVLVCKLREEKTLRYLEGVFIHKVSGKFSASGEPLLFCNFVTDSEAPSCLQPPGSLAIHIHAFYMDILPELLECLGNMPFSFTLFVSVTDSKSRENANDLIKKAGLKLENVDIQITPNRGRDIAPFFVEFGEKLQRYDFIAHLHTKKSLYRWRQYLYKGLLGSTQRIQAILGFLASSDYGIAYPQTFMDIPVACHTWLTNFDDGVRLLNRMGIQSPRGYFDFPAGSMFWAKKDALQPLFDLHLSWEDFPKEAGQNDGTTAHALERALGIVPSACGFRHAIIRETENPRRTPWGMETLNYSGVLMFLRSAQYGYVMFDIFDTLLTRPFLVPEDIKKILAQFAEKQGVQNFVTLRETVENSARLRTGHDVDIDKIYAEAIQTGALTQAQATALRKQEIKLEKVAVQARDEVVILLKQLLHENIPVGIASDTFLPKSVVKELFAKCDIPRPETLYLSCDCGKRKDSGKMYDYICLREKVSYSQLAMVGDDTYSDAHVPGSKGICSIYTPSAFDLARCYPDMRALVDEALSSSDLSLRTLTGYIVEAGFSSLDTGNIGKHTFLPSYEPYLLGKVFMAPLLFGFVDWLAGKAEADGTGKLFFLACDGQIMHKVYEWRRKITGRGPESAYLLVPNRATAVSLCNCMKNIKSILEFFFPRIRQQAAREQDSLDRYLQETGFDLKQKPGFVDIDYHETVQKYLSTFFNHDFVEYYLMARTMPKKDTDDNTTNAYLMSELDEESPYYNGSFFMKKLFAAEHEQIIQHKFCQGKKRAIFRQEKSSALRDYCVNEIHEGIFSGLERLVEIEQMLGSFPISIETLRKVYLALTKEVKSGRVSSSLF